MTRGSEDSRFATAIGRWAGVGPYYAMFPVDFADKVIQAYTRVGDWILDPFAGRATSLFSAATQGRFGIGVEINPVGWVYGRAKLQTARWDDVEMRIRWLGSMAREYRRPAEQLPEFFKRCFCRPVREFLLAARDLLRWRYQKTDWTTMALILVDLHGKRENSFSNQMRQTKAMSPQYAIDWWQEQGLEPPHREPVEFMLKKIAWRYARGRVHSENSRIYLGDSRLLLGKFREKSQIRGLKPAKLLFTSPPYCGVTNYFYDQWLRLWMLGGTSQPRSSRGDCKRKFAGRKHYLGLLQSVFQKTRALLASDAVVYVRTDARRFTLESTAQVLKEVFPRKRMRYTRHTRPEFTQTSLFDEEAKPQGEVDLVLW